MSLADIGIEEGRHIPLRVFLENHVVYVWVVILECFIESFLSFNNEVEFWISRDVGEAVRVWVSTLTELEAEPVLERLLFARRHDILHDIIDDHFHANDVQHNDDIRIVQDPVAPLLRRLFRHRIEAVDFVTRLHGVV